MEDCARAFAQIVELANGPGLRAVREALRGEEWLGPDPRAERARHTAKPTPIPQGWVGQEETELVEPSSLQ
eukprot:3498268-Alexandrium_andersonii.AAC.1